MKEREEMWQKIEELARLNPQVRFCRHCPELRGPMWLREGLSEEAQEAYRSSNF